MKLTDADREHIALGIERWKKTGYGIDPNQLAFRHWHSGAQSCPHHECSDNVIEGYDLHGLPPQYAPVVAKAWDDAGPGS